MTLSLASQDLFPTRIWVCDCDDLLARHPAWLQHIADWRQAEPTPQGRSNRGGWNSPLMLFEHPVFAPLRERVGQAFLAAFQAMLLERPVRFQMEAWVNLHERGSFNVSHVHPHALMSACYYLQVPEGAGRLVFRDPRPAKLISALPSRAQYARGEWALRPRAGQLVIFPHWLEHWVDPHEGDQPRVAISINARPALPDAG